MTLVVSQWTPVGRGAVAVVEVRGAGASQTVSRLFHSASQKPLTDFAVGRIVFGRWGNASDGEELVVCRRSETRVEIHCHGGVAAPTAIVRELVEAGCREAAWSADESLAEADPIARDARRALAAVRTERAAAVLLDQYHGALRNELACIAADLQAGKNESGIDRLAALSSWAEFGLHLTTPWRVVLAGAPNVGKSSLINSLLGYQRSVVFDQPGTTRDVVSASAAIGGWAIELSDTAGLRDTRDAIEAEGVRRAREQLLAADLVLLVTDASLAGDEETVRRELLGDVSPRRLVLVRNKWDLRANREAEASREPAYRSVATSALSGDGVANLWQTIRDELVPREPAPGTAIPFTRPQIVAVAEAYAAAQSGRTADALRAVWSITSNPIW